MPFTRLSLCVMKYLIWIKVLNKTRIALSKINHLVLLMKSFKNRFLPFFTLERLALMFLVAAQTKLTGFVGSIIEVPLLLVVTCLDCGSASL